MCEHKTTLVGDRCHTGQRYQYLCQTTTSVIFVFEVIVTDEPRWIGLEVVNRHDTESGREDTDSPHTMTPHVLGLHIPLNTAHLVSKLVTL